MPDKYLINIFSGAIPLLWVGLYLFPGTNETVQGGGFVLITWSTLLAAASILHRKNQARLISIGFGLLSVGLLNYAVDSITWIEGERGYALLVIGTVIMYLVGYNVGLSRSFIARSIPFGDSNAVSRWVFRAGWAYFLSIVLPVFLVGLSLVVTWHDRFAPAIYGALFVGTHALVSLIGVGRFKDIRQIVFFSRFEKGASMSHQEIYWIRLWIYTLLGFGILVEYVLRQDWTIFVLTFLASICCVLAYGSLLLQQDKARE